MTNHLWQSTLFAVATGLLTLAFRKNRAQVRYWLWFSASLKFFLPLSLLIAMGIRLQPAPAATQIGTPAVSLAIEQAAEPFPETVSFAALTPATRDWTPIALLALWACGFAAIAMIRLRGWLRIRRAVRASSPLDFPSVIEVRSSPGLLEPGVVGLFRPILLVPAGIAECLTPRQLDAVLAHELCHIRRRDNLTSAIHMIVEGVFWFHPLVWWIGAKLVEERERACDEAVLSLGGEPRVYAEAILNVCKLYVESPLACVSGVTGADLKKRIEAIMANRIALRLNFAKKVALAIAAMVAVTLPVIVGMVNAQALRVQDAPRFEVASVRPSDPNADGIEFRVEHRRVSLPNLNLLALIVQAYGLRGCRPHGEFECVLLSGGPEWLRKDEFDIVAKMPDDSLDTSVTLVQFQNGHAPQVQLMLQALLADRFHLKLHREPKEVPVFALTIGKKGSRLKKADEAEETKMFFRGSVGSDGQRMFQLVAQNSSMQELADLLAKFLDRPVLDQTGIKDRYDLTLDYEANADAPGMFTDATGPGLFRALQDQAGLKLAATQGTVEVLVIDHAERPSEN